MKKVTKELKELKSIVSESRKENVLIFIFPTLSLFFTHLLSRYALLFQECMERIQASSDSFYFPPFMDAAERERGTWQRMGKYVEKNGMVKKKNEMKRNGKKWNEKDEGRKNGINIRKQMSKK